MKLLKNIFKKKREKLKCSNYRSFSQFGEDLIVDFALTLLKAKNIVTDFTYLDIGGNMPMKFSNTYMFYDNGYKGVIIEPNKRLYENYVKYRPNDTVLNLGIHFTEDDIQELPFYQMNDEANGLSTFSKESAENSIKTYSTATNYDVILTKVKSVNNIIKEYFADKAPTFISLDVEGIDLDILKSFDFALYRPIFWCVETTKLTKKNSISKKYEVTNFMLSKGYVAYADTFVNTIFIDKTVLERMTL